MQVAGRYLPRQYLIGPSVFPAYWYALKSLVIIFAAIAILLALAALVFDSEAPLAAVVRTVGSTAWGLLAWSAILTGVFATLEQSGFRFDSFRPEHLSRRPALAPRIQSDPIPRFESLFDIVFSITVLVWWIGDFSNAQLLFADVEADWSTAYSRFFVPVLALLILGLIRAGRNLVRPYWTNLARISRMTHVGLWIAVLIWALNTPGFVTFDAVEGAMNPGFTARLVAGLEQSLPLLLKIWVFIGAAHLAFDLYRLLRR
ncbi:MAG TPA: hypothetical protein VMR74_03910 [Gammaproteobacteria bacterium]|nr:hypothetical protein [Gammaproteobacteria bacterium]